MGTYKVPQDVEAEDKLIGPFSFRQFIYLIIVAIGLGGAWGLFMILPPLALIPLPIVLVFGALALPLRKDQPMEIYLAALVSFYLRPRKRFWQPDGRESLVRITVPKSVDIQRAKDISGDEADRRFSYLANLVDSRGWSVRGVADQQLPVGSALSGSLQQEANATPDMFDTMGEAARSFEQRLQQSDAKHHQEMVTRMKQGMQTPAPQAQPQPAPPQTQDVSAQQPQPNLVQQAQDPSAYSYTPADPYANLSQQPAQAPEPKVQYDPYPTSMNQSVIQPLGQNNTPAQPQAPAAPPEPAHATPEPEESTSEKQVSPDIINLANNADLSIETIAHEANRIREKEEKEVVISLR